MLNVNGIQDYINVLSNSKLGTFRISKSGNILYGQVVYEKEQIDKQIDNSNEKIMGVDVGLKVPAVSYIQDDNKVKFFGNGRENKVIRRRAKAKRKRLAKAKKLKALRKLNNKENRQMKDIDHKISRQIINHAAKNNVSIIKVEKLSNIRNTTRTSRKNEKNLHTWSFFRLLTYIEYKAKLCGIEVLYVDPKYTSQTCPICSKKNKTKGRSYSCSCGYKSHRDIVGALNISRVTVVDSNSLSA